MEVVTEVPDDASPEFLGAHYVAFVASFWTGERSGLNEVATTKPKEAPPGEPQAAADRLAEGKKPRTVDEADEMAKQLIEKGLDATVISEEQKPWEKKVDAPARPWETKPEVKVATVDW